METYTDIGKILASGIDIRKLSREDTYRILKKEPDCDAASYPRTQLTNSSTFRQFQPSWLKKQPWLHYSRHCDGAFCRACALFAITPERTQTLGQFVNKPFKMWTKMSEKMNAHASQEYHKTSMEKMSEFFLRYEEPTLAVHNILDEKAKNIIENNRKVIESLMRIVAFCGKQGIALRGHRDDKITWMEDEEKRASNEGNFIELVRFRAETDQVLLKHLENAPKNAKYTSKTIQNELIDVIGKAICNEIIEEVLEARFYTVIADEVTDISNKEQLSICLRYVHNSVIKEVFVDFAEAERITGETLANVIIQWLSKQGLSLANLRGQCYDGASNMSGARSGCKTIVQKEAPLALYFHCAAHRLNLAIVSACKIPQIKNAESYVGEIARFFNNSAKRQRLLDKAFELQSPHGSNAKKLKDACRTRWVLRIDAYIVFAEMLPAVHTALEAIVYPHQHQECGTNWMWDTETVTKANGFLFQLESTPFLISLTILQRILYLLRELTIKLQMQAMDVSYAYSEVNSIISTLKTMRENSVAEFTRIFKDTTKMAQELHGQDFELSKPRIARRQTNRDNHDVESVEDYFRVTLYNEFISHAVNELLERFGNNPAKDVTLGLLCLLPRECICFEDGVDLPDKLAETAKMYSDDMPHSQMLPTEYSMWIRKWKQRLRDTSLDDLPRNLVDVFQSCNCLQFPNIHILLRLALTLPITSCESERSFSQLKLIKSDRRSAMCEERLSGLALMKINRDLCDKLVSNEGKMAEMVKSFEQLHPRRMKLAYILQ